MFELIMGVPEVESLLDDITARLQKNTLDADGLKFFKKLSKAFDSLRNNPRHNSLQTHEIDVLSKKFGQKVFQSYLENNTPSAGRIFWTYGPKKNEITILAIDKHPENKKRGAYARVSLSKFPK